jgi:hypothetical protein
MQPFLNNKWALSPEYVFRPKARELRRDLETTLAQLKTFVPPTRLREYCPGMEPGTGG